MSLSYTSPSFNFSQETLRLDSFYETNLTRAEERNDGVEDEEERPRRVAPVDDVLGPDSKTQVLFEINCFLFAKVHHLSGSSASLSEEAPAVAPSSALSIWSQAAKVKDWKNQF